ncbi:MAG: zinc-ribbon domain-containing protein [Pseudomonadota bacterium]
MRLECANCGATYDVADNAIPSEGREVQCAKCNHVWLQMPAQAQDADNQPLTLEPTSEVIDGEANSPTAQEPTEFRTFRAENLPDTQVPQEMSSEVAEILEDEAEFARAARAEPSEEELAPSPLEALRQRVSEAEVGEMPADIEGPEQEELSEDTVSDLETEELPAAQTDEVLAEEAHKDDLIEPSSEEMPTEANNPTPRQFRKLGGRPAATQPQTDDNAAKPPRTEPAQDNAAAPKPEKSKRRQSLADISQSGPSQSSVTTDVPASKPFDLGPAAPEERPEAPTEVDVARKAEDLPDTRSIAPPEMPRDLAAQRALEELNALELDEPKQRGRFAGIFAVLILIIAILGLIYVVGPILAEVIPGIGPVVESYRDFIGSIFGALGINFGEIGTILSQWLESLQ